MIAPLDTKKYRLTQNYGVNPEAYKRFNLAGHNGLDYGCPVNTPLVSPISGTITEVSYDENGYGWYIKIENDKEAALVAHLTESLVKVGYSVKEGEWIGNSGNTGNSTGPHVHFGYYLKPRHTDNGFNGYIDPEPYIETSGSAATMTDTQLPITDTDPNYVKQIEADREMFWKQRDEALAQVQVLQGVVQTKDAELNDLNTKFTEKFKLLDLVEKLGFVDTKDSTAIDKLTKLTNDYREMYQADFPNLDSIKAKMVNICTQNQTLLQENDRLTQERNEAVTRGANAIVENIDLKGKLEELTKKYAAYDPDSVFNRVARLLQVFSKFLPKDKFKLFTTKAEKVIENVEAVEPQAVQAMTAWTEFSQSIGVTNKQ